MKNYYIGKFNANDPMNPYIIAEIGVNHEGSLELAKQLIKEAKDGGAHAAKFQSYKAGKIASKHSPAYWDKTKEATDSQYKLFQKYDGFGEDEYKELASYCATLDIDFMSTPFDLEAVDFLADLMPAFKIASADITNIPLIRKCARQGKPLIMSTGAATFPEIEFAINTAKEAGAINISILHCVLNYPTPEENAELGMIETLAKTFPDLTIGYSDHVCPDKTISALEVACLKGACILEKHFTHDKSIPGNDHYHAMNKSDLINFVKKITTYKKLLNKGSKDISKESSARLHARRSIVANGKIKKGELLTESNLICKRPAHGISPIHWDSIIGKVALQDINDDDLLTWQSFE